MSLFENDDSLIKNGFLIEEDMKLPIATEGSEDKFFILFNNKKYLVKDSSFNKRRKKKSLAPFCEYVGSHFVKYFGIECQDTFLARYDGRDVVVCADIFEDFTFRPFKELYQSNAGTALGNKEYTYSDLLYILKKKKGLKGSHLDNVISELWKRFLLDAILGNGDRHEANWGFVKKGTETYLAPVFDNGSSLFPDVDLTKTYSKDFCKDRVYRMPASQFRM